MSRENGAQILAWQMDAKFSGGPQRARTHRPLLGEALP